MSNKKDTRRSAGRAGSPGTGSEGFTDEERAAMKERAKELKAEARATKDREAGERDVLEKIATTPTKPGDRPVKRMSIETIRIVPADSVK